MSSGGLWSGITISDSGGSGTPGPPGPTGPAGANGAIGLDGQDGQDGVDSLVPGPQGLQGIQGPAGTNGTIGRDGMPGLPGFDGEDGFDGFPGQIGPQGTAGAAGATGPRGLQGIPGPMGLDGEEAEFPYLIPGPVGPPGLVGGNYAQINPADVSAISATGPFLMAGLASGTTFITPVSTGVVLVTLTSYKINGSGIGSATYHLNWGTGNGPAMNDAEVGTTITTLSSISNNSSAVAAVFVGIIRGATINTPLWVDIAVSNGGTTTAFQDINIMLAEYAGAGFATFLGGVPGIDAEEPEMPYIIPGPQGPAGTSSGGAVTLTDFTKDLGVSRRSGTFDITGLSGLTVDKNVQIIQTAKAIASKGDARDEAEMDYIDVTGYVLDANTIRAYWFSSDKSVAVGTYAFAYLVGA